MPDVGNPHDSLFKATLGQPEQAADFLQHYLPAAVAALLDLDPASLTRRHESYVDQDLGNHAADLVYQARLRDGGDAVIYVLFEHKSRQERLVAFQLLRYQVRIWEEDLRSGRPLLPIIPVVVYHGRARWRVGQTHSALFTGPEALRPYWPEFRFEVTDLSHLSVDEIRGTVITQVALRTLGSIFDPRLREELPGIVGLLRDVMDQDTVPELLTLLLNYISAASSAFTQVSLTRVVTEALEAKAGDVVTTLAETWLQQGRQQGREQGRELGLQQGLQQARSELLAGIELALELKFGASGTALMPELAQIDDVATLHAVRDAIRPATSVADVRRVYGSTDK